MMKSLKLESRIIIPLGYALVFLAVLLIWQLSSKSFLVPSVKETITYLVNSIGSGRILLYAQNTFRAVFIGFGLSVAFGLLLGVFLGLAHYWRAVWEPIVLGAYSVPKIILFPIFIVFFGIGVEFKVVMALIHGFFPMVINVTSGIKEINLTLLKVGKCYQCNSLQFLTKIYLPAIALPFIIGVRLAFSLCILGVVVVEILIKGEGLGSQIMSAYYMQELPPMFAYIIFLFSVAFLGNLCFWVLERRLERTR
jgi:ABC-type nitrate/sulfonate/bicarbonate transport system permease component